MGRPDPISQSCQPTPRTGDPSLDSAENLRDARGFNSLLLLTGERAETLLGNAKKAIAKAAPILRSLLKATLDANRFL